MNPIEAETITRLQDVGLDFTPYVVPDSYIPPTLVGPASNILEEAEEDEE